MATERAPRVQRCPLFWTPTPGTDVTLIATLGVLSMLQPAVLAVNPRYFCRVVIILVLVITLVVVARMPIPELPPLPLPPVM